MKILHDGVAKHSVKRGSTMPARSDNLVPTLLQIQFMCPLWGRAYIINTHALSLYIYIWFVCNEKIYNYYAYILYAINAMQKICYRNTENQEFSRCQLCGHWCHWSCHYENSQCHHWQLIRHRDDSGFQWSIIIYLSQSTTCEWTLFTFYFRSLDLKWKPNMTYDNISMLELKLIHVRKRRPRCL